LYQLFTLFILTNLYFTQALIKRGWIEVAVGRSGSHRVHSSLSHAAAIRHAREYHGGGGLGSVPKHPGYLSSSSSSNNSSGVNGTSSTSGRSSSRFNE